MTESERIVRECWEQVTVCDGSYLSYPRGAILINWATHCFYDFPDWDAAAAFTLERKEEVRQIREARDRFRFICSALAPEEWATLEPLDNLIGAELARLQQGMRKEAQHGS